MFKINDKDSDKVVLNSLLKSEFWLSFLIGCLAITISYYCDGVQGVEDFVNGLNTFSSKQGIILILGSVCSGLFFYIVHKYFNSQNKDVFSLLAKGLLGVIVSVCRSITGILFSFSILYLIKEGYNNVLIIFVLSGIVFLIYSTFFSFIKYKMFERKNRPLKGGVMY